ncbi:KNR4-like cell wall assembly/cell proliferation coordinating protein [Pseudoalteromonas sp. CO325X]|uniref:SMI1/KNR4 family protein n=1 Tax=Pseudoalteromonas sp. CO325X TaxID=1777262 RepID=UPI001023B8E3|nr:SMI1/KNR4 family protein [Pseudoalteromonas sp. CO325X]RZF77342.1 KNR4-like cell wall assembly/cell proliferation coordinating protein [Pseudoalteromonas sp. CO325X]
MKNEWNGIIKSLNKMGCLDETKLNPSATPSEVEELEKHLGVTLPAQLKEFLFIHNGQDDQGAGIVFGELILSTSSIKRYWDGWRDIDEEEMNEDCADFMESEPLGFIKPLYTNRKWIPLTHDWGGNHIGIDYDPDEKGATGQIIAFGRDEDTKRLIAPDFKSFISKLNKSLSESSWTGEFIDGQIA